MLVGVIVAVPVGVTNGNAVDRLVPVALGVIRIIIIDLDTVAVAVSMGGEV